MYRNYMGTLSILLIEVVEADLMFLYAGVGRNSPMNDSGVWAATSLRAHIGRGSAGFPEPAQLRNSSKVAPFVIIGNEGFRLKPCLLRSFPADELKNFETMFNYWPPKAVKVVKATIALHNFLRKHNSSGRRRTAPERLDIEDVLTGMLTQEQEATMAAAAQMNLLTKVTEMCDSVIQRLAHAPGQQETPPESPDHT
ncbi:hypothetical protein HPB47_015225 [Ixodes persulcatus]|uniref:Uncharacterized protein n=1 Tax=Ixodes persulcatus TaxID=34615 RepID=A0AC60QU19_IXOPE|nr:hypothetical protein HPB47_015225 [Ixodes persulcatus]